jgi:predicted nucleic acid-binding Zn ribbon protein
MKYRHAHKEEYAGYFQRLAAGKESRRKPRANCIQCGSPIPRSAHRFCSHGCYFLYKTEHAEEYESAYAAMREKLTTRKDRACDHCQKLYKPWSTDSRFCSSECYFEYRSAHPDKFPKHPESQRIGYAKFAARTDEYEKWCKNNSERMKANNPMRDPEALKKAMKSCREYWDRARWGSSQEEPRLEVGHVYWHPAEEIKQTVNDYSCIGYECLYLTNDDLADRAKYEEVVRKFCGQN